MRDGEGENDGVNGHPRGIGWSPSPRNQSTRSAGQREKNLVVSMAVLEITRGVSVILCDSRWTWERDRGERDLAVGMRLSAGSLVARAAPATADERQRHGGAVISDGAGSGDGMLQAASPDCLQGDRYHRGTLQGSWPCRHIPSVRPTAGPRFSVDLYPLRDLRLQREQEHRMGNLSIGHCIPADTWCATRMTDADIVLATSLCS